MDLKAAGETLWNPWAEELTNAGAQGQCPSCHLKKKDKIWGLWVYLRIKTPIKSWQHSVRHLGSLLILRRESAWGFCCLFKQTNLINPVKVLPRVLLLYLRFIPSSWNGGWGEEVPLTNAENKSCFIPSKCHSSTFPKTTNTSLSDAKTTRPTQRHGTQWSLWVLPSSGYSMKLSAGKTQQLNGDNYLDTSSFLN